MWLTIPCSPARTISLSRHFRAPNQDYCISLCTWNPCSPGIVQSISERKHCISWDTAGNQTCIHNAMGLPCMQVPLPGTHA